MDWIDEIKARCEEATPGPWSNPWKDDNTNAIIGGDGDHVIDIYEDGSLTALMIEERNAAFITHAREDIPRLVAEVERLQALVDEEIGKAAGELITTLITYPDAIPEAIELIEAFLVKDHIFSFCSYCHAKFEGDNAEEEAAAHVKQCASNPMVAEVERLRAQVDTIKGWIDAYPLDVFPEPDFQKARELLAVGGITLDAVSASNMRHVLSGLREIVEWVAR